MPFRNQSIFCTLTLHCSSWLRWLNPSEIFSILKKCAKPLSACREDAQDSNLAHFFGWWSQTEKLSNIKPPLQLKKRVGLTWLDGNTMKRRSRTADWIIFGRHSGGNSQGAAAAAAAATMFYFAKSRQDLNLGGLASRGGPGGESNLSLLLFWKIETPSANILWLCAAANLAKSDIKYECGLVLLTPTNHHQPSHKIFQPRTHTF